MPLTNSELTACRDLLVSARTAALWVADLFFNDGNIGSSARLRGVADELADAIGDIDRLLNQPKP